MTEAMTEEMTEATTEEHRTNGAADAQDKLESSKTHAIATEYRDKAEQTWNDARDRVRTFQDYAAQYVHENATKAVVTAVGIGFVLGMIFRHKRTK